MQLGALISATATPPALSLAVSKIASRPVVRRSGRAQLLAYTAHPDGDGVDAAFAVRAPGQGPLTLVADARIDNRAELGAALGLGESARATLTDTDLIARAYARWGSRCAARILGDFAFALWDEPHSRLFAACDPLGMRTLHYARRGGAWALGSSAELTLALLGAPARVDRRGLAGWLVGRPQADRAVLAGVCVLSAGHTLMLEHDRVQVRRYWGLDPQATLRLPSLAQYAEHLSELLARCVADRLPGDDTTVAAQLSGGMDSTSVAALAAGQLADPAQQLLAVSHRYTPATQCDERDLIQRTARQIGVRRHLWLPVQAHTGLPYPELYPPVLDSPGTVLSPRYLDELRQLHRQGAQVLLTGSGGDEMTWGHSLSYGQRLRRGDLGVIAEVVAGAREHQLPLLATLVNLLLRPWVPAGVRRLRRRLIRRPPWPAWMPTATARALDLEQALYGDADRRFANPALQARYTSLVHSSTYHSVRSYAAAGEHTGVTVRHPFFDRRLAEFSFAIPDDLWLREGYPKWLARRAMTGRLPDAVVWNRRKVVFDRFFARLLKDQRALVRDILSHPGLQDLGLVDNRRLLVALDLGLERQPPTVSVDLLHALMTQVWFQRHAQTLGY